MEIAQLVFKSINPNDYDVYNPWPRSSGIKWMKNGVLYGTWFPIFDNDIDDWHLRKLAFKWLWAMIVIDVRSFLGLG